MSEESRTLQVLSTPNPEALKFQVGETLVASRAYEFVSAEAAVDSPLARGLFAIEGVQGVLVGPDFVTVTKAAGLDWGEFQPLVQRAILDFLKSGELALLEEDAVGEAAQDATTGSGIEQRIQTLIYESVLPALAQDGGSIEFVGLEEGVVKVRLQGACGSCPHATMTLAYGVERFLKEHVPEVTGVERVM